MGFIPIFVSCFVLSALSISNLGLISSMVGFLHDQKDNTHYYLINWPNNPVWLGTEPKGLLVDQGHTSNGLAGYGFFLGLWGMYVAWRQRNRQGKPPSKTLLSLFILQILAVIYALAALIYVFVLTNNTDGQSIQESVAKSYVTYPADQWTPENWYKAVVKLPMAEESQRDHINSNITNMVAWRWMLIPIFLTTIVCLAFTTLEWLKQRKGTKSVESADYPAEK